MNRKILLAAGGLALAAIATPAAAQTTKPVGLSIRAGVVFPTNGELRDVGRTLFGAGLEYKLSGANLGQSMGANSNAHLSISADYYGKNNASSIPVLLNIVGSNNEFFYSAGAGVAFSRDSETTAGVTSTRNKTNFGYQLGIGYNFQQSQTPVFIEAKYWGNGNSALNAVGVYLGIRL